MSTHVEEGSSKQYCFMEGAELKDLTHFFRLPTILPSWLPRTIEEFVVVVSTKDLNFSGVYLYLTGGGFWRCFQHPVLG